jgi:cytochrome P450
VSRAFTPRRIKEIEPRIRQIADDLLDSIERDAGFDLMEDLASPLPMIVIAEMLGVPPEEHAQFKAWSNQIIEGGRMAFGGASPAENMKATSQELRSYLAKQIERRRREPGEDLITALVQAHDEGGALASDELLAFVVLLLLAGNETTTNLIGNGLVALSGNPTQKQRLIDNPAMTKTAIEEILRFESSNQLGNRMTTEPVELGGIKLAAGTPVTLCIGAANRDPAQFADPEDLNVGRTPNRHLAFGTGAHQCAGMALARLEGAIAISRFLARFPGYALSAPPVRGGRVRFRGFLSVPCVVG